jgi:hypothetical protein
LGGSGARGQSGAEAPQSRALRAVEGGVADAGSISPPAAQDLRSPEGDPALTRPPLGGPCLDFLSPEGAETGGSSQKRPVFVSRRAFWSQIRGHFGRKSVILPVNLACTLPMSARHPGTTSLSPRHVCQIHGHTKLATPACLADLPALQACYPGMSGRFAGTTSLLPGHVWQICRHCKLVTPACLADLPALQACHPGMSARFMGTPSLLPRHVCQIHGHTKMGTRACLADSWARQDGCPPKSVGFVGALGWVPAQNRRFSGYPEVFSPRIRGSWPQRGAGDAVWGFLCG